VKACFWKPITIVTIEIRKTCGMNKLNAKMEKQVFSVMWLFCINFFFSPAFSQDIGSIFCWHYKEIYGGHDYEHNQSILKRNFPYNNTHWSDNYQWWENIVEEIEYSGLDYIALLSRGNQPNAPDRGNGNPKHIPTLINAMHKRGAANSFKLALFDDPPTWNGSKNWDDSKGTRYSTEDPKLDLSNPDNYKYIWEYNLKQAIEHIPEAMRYEIDGRLVIFFWTVSDSWFVNIQGNLSKILKHVNEECLKTFGFKPYIIIQHTWLERDTSLSNSGTFDAVHGWLSQVRGRSWSLVDWNGVKTGVLVPGFKPADDPRHLDPFMGTDDSGKMLKTGLDNTVKAGARTTLIEGFTNAAETASVWRSNDQGKYVFYQYPNQRLNIVRSYTSNPFPDTLKVEAEACDFHFDLTPGNSGGAYLYMGDLDVVKCSDTYEGWNVTNTQANEWMEWREMPLLKESRFELRYKSTAPSSVKISIDHNDLPATSLPSTQGIWTTIDIGTNALSSNGLHTVRLTIDSGSPDINYFTRIDAGTTGLSSVLRPVKQNDIRIFPNPANDFVRISSQNEIGEITLLSLTGELLMKKVYGTGKEIELDVSYLKSGLYFLIINNESHKLVVR
jgi:hypothetical protein